MRVRSVLIERRNISSMSKTNLMIFREARVEDIPALNEIRHSVKENVLSDPGGVTFEMYVEYLTSAGKGWLCEIEGETAGFCIASLEDATIWALFVKPEHEQKGIGSRLLKLATGWLFAKGATSIGLSTETDTRADRFYQSRGWKRGEVKANGEVIYRLNKPV